MSAEEEPKEFSDLVKPIKKQNLETFNEINNSDDTVNVKKEESKKPEKDTDEWNEYFKELQSKYAKTVREKGYQNNFTIPVVNDDGDIKNVSYHRKRLSVKELRLLAAKQKQYDEMPKDNMSLFEAEALASLYLEFAQMLMINNDTGKPITKDEFEQQDWGTIRSIVDNCLLKSLVGTTG